MSKSFITINNNKVDISQVDYADTNANAILLSGHILHLLNTNNSFAERKLNINNEDHEIILRELENAECWLLPSIKVMGELISAADKDQLEDSSLNYAGYLISGLTRLLSSVQHTRKLVVSCDQESRM